MWTLPFSPPYSSTSRGDQKPNHVLPQPEFNCTNICEKLTLRKRVAQEHDVSKAMDRDTFRSYAVVCMQSMFVSTSILCHIHLLVKHQGQGGSKKPFTHTEDAIWHQVCSRWALEAQSPLKENSRNGNSNSLTTTICFIKLGYILRQPSLPLQSIRTDNGDAWFHKTITEAPINVKATINVISSRRHY